MICKKSIGALRKTCHRMALSLTLFALCFGCNKAPGKIDWSSLEAKYRSADPIYLKSLMFLRENLKGVSSEIPFLKKPETDSTFSLNELQKKGVDTNELAELVRQGYQAGRTYKSDSEILTTGQIDTFLTDAISSWKRSSWKNDVPEKIFLNYLLPYKISTELPNGFRHILTKERADEFPAWQNKNGFEYQASKVAYIDSLINGFIIPIHEKYYRYSPSIVNVGIDPSFEELSLKKAGDCFYEAFIETYLLRAKGIPAAFDFIPAWGSANGSHAFTSYWNSGQQKMRLIIGFRYSPAKIYRRMFKYQGIWTDRIAPLLSGQKFPISFLMSDFVTDVTDEHTSTSTVRLKVNGAAGSKIAYLSVLNYGKWEAISWAEIRGDVVSFEKMGRNVMYRLSVPINDTEVELGNPFILDTAGRRTRLETFDEKTDLTLNAINSGKDSYVRAGKEYVLSCIDKSGEVLPLQIVRCARDSVVKFTKVPRATVYQLTTRPASPLARPFLYKNGAQTWL